jgi:hypothetical protein
VQYDGGKSQNLYFLGVSPRLSNRNAAIETALKDAARRFSLFNSVNGNITMLEHIGGEVMNYKLDKEYTLQYDTELEKYIEQLEYDPLVDIFENNNAVFVLTHVATEVFMPQYKGHSVGKEHPKWISSPPSEIDGYIASVGYSSRLSSHSDTIIKSYENAVLGIIENLVTQVNREYYDSLNSYSAFGFDMASSSVFNSSCTLKNFYIIESWTDSANLSVWTLAIASADDKQK